MPAKMLAQGNLGYKVIPRGAPLVPVPQPAPVAQEVFTEPLHT